MPNSFFKKRKKDSAGSQNDDKPHMTDERQGHGIGFIMTRDVVCINMDTTLGKALDLCSQKRIRHLPVLDEDNRLVGIVTDRDLRYFISPRLGTLSENSSDRESMNRHVHQMMVRQVVCAGESITLAEAAQMMLDNRIGCLLVVDSDRRVIGILTTTDLIRYVAQNG
jgi:CBS domain-containing protein